MFLKTYMCIFEKKKFFSYFEIIKYIAKNNVKNDKIYLKSKDYELGHFWTQKWKRRALKHKYTNL